MNKLTIVFYLLWAILTILTIVCPFRVLAMPLLYKIVLWVMGGFNLISVGILTPSIIGYFKNKK